MTGRPVRARVCLCGVRCEELRQCQAATAEQMGRYEAKHLGGFKRIYPREGGEKYDKYFKHSSSLFQETAASKAREECARYQHTHTHTFTPHLYHYHQSKITLTAAESKGRRLRGRTFYLLSLDTLDS